MHSFRHSLAKNVSDTPGVNIEKRLWHSDAFEWICSFPSQSSLNSCDFAHSIIILPPSQPTATTDSRFFDRGALRLIWAADWSVPPSFPPQIALWWESCPQWISIFPWRRQINHPGFTVLLVKNFISILNCNDPSYFSLFLNRFQ